MHFKGCPYINHKISCNLNCTLTIFLAFHNLFMILVHMEVHSKYHLLMVDSFQIRSGVDWYLKSINFVKQLMFFCFQSWKHPLRSGYNCVCFGTNLFDLNCWKWLEGYQKCSNISEEKWRSKEPL